MSLPSRRMRKSVERKMKERAKSLQHLQKVAIKDELKKQKSISRIVQQVVKQTNEYINSINKSEQKVDRRLQYHLHQNDVMIRETYQKKVAEIRGEMFNWEIDKIEEKRKINGLKIKIVWSNGKDNIRILVRVVLTENYLRYNQVDYFVELESANVEIKFQQQKQIQKMINKVVEQEQAKTEDQHEIENWLKITLISCNNLFWHMRLNERAKLKQVVQFKKVQINNRYILYPCPASVTWSAHGLFCISENKVSTNFKSIIGNIHSYRHLVQAPKFKGIQLKHNEIQDLKMIDQRKDQQQEGVDASFYGWDASEQINFSVFVSRGAEMRTKEEIFKGGKEMMEQKVQKRGVANQEIYLIDDTTNIAQNVQKMYKRYFVGYCQNPEFEFHEKLKVFTVKNQISELEDGILYLINKIKKVNNREEGIIESLLENQFSGYKNLLNKNYKEKNNFFEKQKYELISEFLQEKIKNTPQSQHFLYTKSVIIQNQFFRLALQNYYEESFKRLKISDKNYQCLGTYDNFDDINAEKILFELLEEHLKMQKHEREEAIRIKNKYREKPEKYDDKEYKIKKYRRMEQQNEEMKLLLKGYAKKKSKHLQDLSEGDEQPVLMNFQEFNLEELPENEKEESGENEEDKQEDRKMLSRNVNLNVMPFLVVNKIEFIPFQFNLILTQSQRESFLKTMIPILWIKDRSNQKFEYKLAKRVVIANAKIIKFLQIMNNIGNAWKRAEGKRSNFLKRIIDEYGEFKESSQGMVGKYYVACCQNCKGEFTAYSILELFRVTLCSRCKYLQEMK